MSVEVGKIYMKNQYNIDSSKFYQVYFYILSKDNLYINVMSHSTLNKNNNIFKIYKDSAFFKEIVKTDDPVIYEIFQEIKTELL